MNWIVFIATAWLALGLDVGLKSALSLQVASWTIAPSFTIPLAVFIAMGSPSSAAMWACLGLGVMMDLLSPLGSEQGTLFTILGPHALAYLLAGNLVLAMRGLVIRRNPIALAFLSCLFGVIVAIAAVFIVSIRKLLGEPIVFDSGHILMERILASVYTGGIAFLLAFALLPLAPLFGFTHHGPRGAGGGGRAAAR